jgi:(E)-4-hydroxy-3-methylbut-2-enyl-diphosphate synthase
VAATVEQVKRCVDAGAEIVRITVQGKKEAAACMDIREALFKDGCALGAYPEVHWT